MQLRKISSSFSCRKKDILRGFKKAKAVLETQEQQLAEVEQEYRKNLSLIPNLPLPTVPVGRDERDNVVLREVGKNQNLILNR